jgi:hypothetical protein
MAAGIAAAALLGVPSTASAADTLLGLTDDNRIVRFNSDSPGQIHSTVAVQGLQAGESLVGIDVRPANDHVYVVGSTNRVYQVNPITGQSRAAFGQFTPGLNGQSFGVDFNPVADALRIVSDADQNLRIPFTGGNAGEAQNDGTLAYATTDSGNGANPSVGGAGYTNSFPGATSTTLYDIDTARDVLVRQDPPNAGTLTTVGQLGVDVEGVAGFDISVQDNVGWASLTPRGATGPSLYRIDLNTGRATPAVTTNDARIGTDRQVRGIAALAGAVPNDTTAPELSVAFSSTILEQNTDVLKPSANCDEACTVTISATVEGITAGSATETLPSAGQETIEITLNSTARRRIARKGTELIRLRIAAVDMAGNRIEQNNRRSRTQTLAARLGG